MPKAGTSKFDFSDCTTPERCRFKRHEYGTRLKEKYERKKEELLGEFIGDFRVLYRDHMEKNRAAEEHLRDSFGRLDRAFDARARELEAEGRWEE